MGYEPTEILSRLREGRPAHTALAEVIGLLFSDHAARHELRAWAEKDPFRRSLTGDRQIDLWRAWREARIRQAAFDLAGAQRHLTVAATLHPASADTGLLVEIEKWLLAARLTGMLNQIPEALQMADIAVKLLHSTATRFQRDPASLVNEVRCLLTVLTNDQTTVAHSDEELLDGWALGHGVALVNELSVLEVRLRLNGTLPERARPLAENAEKRILSYHSLVGLGFDADKTALTAYQLGLAWDQIDPARAWSYFKEGEAVLGRFRDSSACSAAAETLCRLGLWREAQRVYSTLAEILQKHNVPKAAEAVVSAIFAQWKQDKKLDDVQPLIDAIRRFEQSLPKDADARTVFSFKSSMEIGYRLLLTALALASDRSEARMNQMLSAVWALLTKEQLANFPEPSETTGWLALLQEQSRPLAVMKAALAPFPGATVVHLINGIDCLVGIAYGYDRQGGFHFQACVLDNQALNDVVEFLRLMGRQLQADILQDDATCQDAQRRMEALGDRIGLALSSAFADLLLTADCVYHMANLASSIEFPLGGIRLGGQWLAHQRVAMSCSTVSSLRNMLSPNRPIPLPNSRAKILLGDPERGPSKLQFAVRHAQWMENACGVYGFAPEVVKSAEVATVREWLDGAVGLLHYIGHGFSDIAEGLPLGSGVLTPSDIDGVAGVKTPFIFLCACEAGLIRRGSGGFQSGLASRLAEQMAPAVLGFSMAIPECRAYPIAEQFYRHAATAPVGEAARAARQAVESTQPAYSWLALVAYGDPYFRLPALCGQASICCCAQIAATWCSALRDHAVLRTSASADLARKALQHCPQIFRDAAATLIEKAFSDPVILDSTFLDQVESQSWTHSGRYPIESLSLRMVICLERAHQLRLDDTPVRVPLNPDELRRVAQEIGFVLGAAGVVFDMRMHGLAHALLGRLIIAAGSDQGESRLFLEQGAEKLAECAPMSSFAQQIRDDVLSKLKGLPS